MKVVQVRFYPSGGPPSILWNFLLHYPQVDLILAKIPVGILSFMLKAFVNDSILSGDIEIVDRKLIFGHHSHSLKKISLPHCDSMHKVMNEKKIHNSWRMYAIKDIKSATQISYQAPSNLSIDLETDESGTGTLLPIRWESHSHTSLSPGPPHSRIANGTDFEFHAESICKW